MAITAPEPRRGLTKSWALGALGGASIVLSLASIPALSTSMSRDETFGALLATPVWLVAVAVAAVAGWLLTMATPTRRWTAGLSVATAVAALHAAPLLAWVYPRGFTTWLHAGFADYLLAGNAPNTALDVRFNWFSGYEWMGQVAAAAGLPPLGIAVAWPVLVQSSVAAATALLAYSLGAPKRVIALSAWLVVVVSFVGQDYMSPQSMALVLFLGALAFLLRVMSEGHRPRHAVSAAICLFAAGITVIHAFSIVFLIVVTAGLVALRRGRHLWPYLVFEVAAAGSYLAIWHSSPAGGASATFFQDLGSPGTSLSKNILDRLSNSGFDEFRLFVLSDRLAFAATVVAGALLLLWLQHRKGRPVLPQALVIVAAFVVAFVIPYGGESLMRAFMFSAPVATIVWAGALEANRHKVPAVGLAAALAFAMFVPARYGNDVFERFSQGQVQAVQWALANTEPGYRIVSVDFNMPQRNTDIASRTWVIPSPEQLQDPKQIVWVMTNDVTQGVFINSRQAFIARSFIRGTDADLYSLMSRALSSDPRFVLLERFGDDVEVWGLRDGTIPAGTSPELQRALEQVPVPNTVSPARIPSPVQETAP